ncbi:MAG: hypothetical protein ACRETT_06910 [Steroidobacteraceae bacterium]
MTILLIGSLAVSALYLARRWRTTESENVQLRAQVTSLKRQLTKYGRAR